MTQICQHDLVPERRSTPERFLGGSAYEPMSLEQVLDLPLVLHRMPSDYNSLSPTPLDPYRLRIGFAAYSGAALDYMRGQLYQATEDLHADHHSEVNRAEDEILHQHTDRMEKNDSALSRLRDAAASDDDRRTKLSVEQAEGIMQIRAGIGRIGAMLALLDRYPVLESIELSKATRPFCMEAFCAARSSFISSLRSMESAGHYGVHGVNDRYNPYRFNIDPAHGAVITKAKLADADPGNTPLEVISRESSILYDTSSAGVVPESSTANIAGIKAGVIPLDVTNYGRVKRLDDD